MSLFGFLAKDKIQNENKTKPFHENKSADERRDWFSRTKPWHKVPPQIIDAIIDKFGDDPLFEVFVITSMEQGLVGEYEAIGETELVGIPDSACGEIAKILFLKGAAAAQKFSQLFQQGADRAKLTPLYAVALNCLESSVTVSHLCIDSYIQLAALRMSVGRNDDARKWVEAGLRAAQELANCTDAMRQSKIESIVNAPVSIEQAQAILLSMKEELMR